MLSKLQSCNMANRKELDWVGQTEAINDARRLVAHHGDLLTAPLVHELVQAAAPAVGNPTQPLWRLLLREPWIP